MGNRGPKKDSRALKEVKKTSKKSDPEPVVPSAEVVVPEDLSPAAAEVWERLAPDLEKHDVLTGWDVDEFAVLCDVIARNDNARRILDAEGEIVEAPVFDRNGEVTGVRRAKNPWFLIYESTARLVITYGTRFGMSPGDRADLKVGDGPDQEEPKGPERLLS